MLIGHIRILKINNNNNNNNNTLYLSVKVFSTTVLIEDTGMSKQIL